MRSSVSQHRGVWKVESTSNLPSTGTVDHDKSPETRANRIIQPRLIEGERHQMSLLAVPSTQRVEGRHLEVAAESPLLESYSYRFEAR